MVPPVHPPNVGFVLDHFLNVSQPFFEPKAVDMRSEVSIAVTSNRVLRGYPDVPGLVNLQKAIENSHS